MIIEKANPEDAKILTEITFDGKAFWGFSKAELSEWTELLTISPDYITENCVYKLILNSEIAGYYSYIMINESEIKLDNLFLFQKYIGKGFGKLMMEDFLKKAKNLKQKIIILDSEPNAENFYKKFGFITFDKKESVIKNRFLAKMKLILPLQYDNK
ncbi:GNAT family N-acetyltransferase [Halpernia frigidisoli]|uniref:Predicted N-acetyltransferase YhbS n=1 Tax=Halpernia frigidisoli TaxID=1125876 RepID=A0A1I3FJB5_9FLAO|nr:GNAT family N-acetyltransferase [Halpernia frigidisoli]SFI11333.1 Predicted N-acetyltransferase YhbS [Halpernia frigidisoli]